MSSDRSAVRKKYQEEYKKIMRSIPKNKRMPFSKFYKQIRQTSNMMKAKNLTRLPTGETVAAVSEEVDMTGLDDIFVNPEEDMG